MRHGLKQRKRTQSSVGGESYVVGLLEPDNDAVRIMRTGRARDLVCVVGIWEICERAQCTCRPASQRIRAASALGSTLDASSMSETD